MSNRLVAAQRGGCGALPGAVSEPGGKLHFSEPPPDTPPLDAV